MTAIIILVGLLLAFANGANDNFKGVATLFGSGTSRYRGALIWATLCTALGSLAALGLARTLLEAFSGNGLVPNETAMDPIFPAVVALAAGLTVLAATRFGLPISTTHALIGGLVGAGLSAPQAVVHWGKLAQGFLLPLLVSPLLAIVLAALLYPPLRALRQKLGVGQETCVCVGEKIVAVVPGDVSAAQAMRSVAVPELRVGDRASCRVQYRGRFMGLEARRTLDALHYLSAGAVSFARGLNDTPKIAALLLVGASTSPAIAIAAVGLLIAVGGLISARRVAETMSHRVTEMNPGQGFTANLVTALLVIVASRFGLPVSTTHVSCGSLFGLGAATGQAHLSTIAHVVLAWVVTLPIAAALAWGTSTLLR